MVDEQFFPLFACFSWLLLCDGEMLSEDDWRKDSHRRVKYEPWFGPPKFSQLPAADHASWNMEHVYMRALANVSALLLDCPLPLRPATNPRGVSAFSGGCGGL